MTKAGGGIFISDALLGYGRAGGRAAEGALLSQVKVCEAVQGRGAAAGVVVVWFSTQFSCLVGRFG